MRYYLSILIIMTMFIGCTSKTPYTNRSQMIIVSKQKELALGEQSYKQTLSKSKVIKNTDEAKKLKEIGQRIAKVVNNDFKWEFNLIDNPTQNAFCLPGGKVAVYTGILKVAHNDSQLATVISHEIAHALARHGAERMSSEMVSSGIQSIGNILLGASGNSNYVGAFNVAYGAGAQYGVLMPYGRLQESEADEIGIHLMYKAGFNIDEAVNFWKNMSQGKSETNEFFSTHPSSQSRISNITRIINEIKAKK